MSLNAISSGNMASQAEINRGTYFCRRAFYIVPNSREEELTNRGLEYNDQPDWKLQELKLDSVHSTTNALQEFQRLTHEACKEFHWSTEYPLHCGDWRFREHGWKHVSFEELERAAADIRNGRGKSLERNTIFAKPAGYFDDLVRKAACEEPKAVARLWHLCQSREELHRFLFVRYIWCRSDEEMQSLYQSIPTAGELASKYVDCIVADRERPDAEAARKNLMTLINVSSIKGSERLGGRPKNQVNWADVLFIYGMAYGLVRQIRDAEVLLRKAGLSRNLIGDTLKQCLAVHLETGDIKQHVLKGYEIGGVEPNKAAAWIASKMLGVLPSNILHAVHTKPVRF